MRKSLCLALFFILIPQMALAQQPLPLKKAVVNKVELHYVIHAGGAPVVFVHGGLADYREWLAPLEVFAKEGYQVVVYSKRYNYPNKNPAPKNGNRHSALADAEDLAALLKELRLKPVHLVGYSAGAYTALALTLQHPELVRTLTLTEPPVLPWLSDLPGGKAILGEFVTNCFQPTAEAFRKGKDEQALQLTLAYFSGKKDAWAELPADVRSVLWENRREWKFISTASLNYFPALDRNAVRQIKVPVLLLCGEKTLRTHQLINDELTRLLSAAKRVNFAGATHDMWSEQPENCQRTVLEFLKGK
ncbi:MAG: alpha/beta hydrolase [Acidobacteria bacterium]|nr:alpha/beta hydrolase [Acidobacteriota bacterium]